MSASICSCFQWRLPGMEIAGSAADFAPAARVFSVKTRQINLKSFKTKNTRKDICGKS